MDPRLIATGRTFLGYSCMLMRSFLQQFQYQLVSLAGPLLKVGQSRFDVLTDLGS